MKKITVKIYDTLEDRIEEAWVELKELLESYLQDNPDTDDLPELGNDLNDSGKVDELIDGIVTHMTSEEIRDNWYLHEDILIESYSAAGIGTNPRENEGNMAIYLHIEQGIAYHYENEAEEVFENWQGRQIKKEHVPEETRPGILDSPDEEEEETNE
jgi:hypothetical protein